jgi:hypothetical protein
MFTRYLTDIEQLLDAHAADTALKEALQLPRLAVALADPQLRCSAEQLSTWCQEWLRAPATQGEAAQSQSGDFGRRISARVAQLGCDRIPTRALRRLQLRRSVRVPPPRGFRSDPAPGLESRENEVVALCTALLAAARRWYARRACRDPTVQANLARLAVLR